MESEGFSFQFYTTTDFGLMRTSDTTGHSVRRSLHTDQSNAKYNNVDFTTDTMTEQHSWLDVNAWKLRLCRIRFHLPRSENNSEKKFHIPPSLGSRQLLKVMANTFINDYSIKIKLGIEFDPWLLSVAEAIHKGQMQEGLKKEDCAESRNLVAALTSIVAITAQRQSSISRLIKIRTKIEVFTKTLNGKRSQLFHLVWELGDFRKIREHPPIRKNGHEN
ncbi:hypothetical protein OUZ56_005891 [Daphnia magna]|uniref:Uncharacterized protein n=1 Tax=Daphnia magna TaxID=35525 RepID=A0ABQ9YU15_9CRUS|nr:hypothetical protein OUZ56_005891 [Daphnia magna]